MIENDHHQYQIPSSAENSAEQIRARISAIMQPENPEVLGAPYEALKRIERGIHDQRETALELGHRPTAMKRSLLQVLGLVPTPRPSLHDLVDEESHLGGQLFQDGDRFWLDANANNDARQVADWYYVHPNLQNPKEPTVLRFQTTPHAIHKLYNGKEYPMTVADLEHFVQSVAAYTHKIGDLYPIDATIKELSEEIASSKPKRDDFDLAA